MMLFVKDEKEYLELQPVFGKYEGILTIKTAKFTIVLSAETTEELRKILENDSDVEEVVIGRDGYVART